MWETGPGQSLPEWRTVETDFSVDLFGVVQTVEGPHAMGSSGGSSATGGPAGG